MSRRITRIRQNRHMPVVSISFPADSVPRNSEDMYLLIRQIRRSLPGRAVIVHDERIRVSGDPR